MARKGKSTEEIIAFLREAEIRLTQGETAGRFAEARGSRNRPVTSGGASTAA
jgi:hypothetical protein